MDSMNGNDKEAQVPQVVNKEEDDAPILGMGDDLIQIAREAETRVDAVNKIKLLALKVTNSHDWIDEHGKPYLQVSGAEKVARLFGVSWRISEPVCDNFPDGHFAYTYSGVFSLRTASVTAIGTRSSKDDFFSKAFKWENGSKVQTEVQPDKVDRQDVKKGAYTNCIGNGITRLLGIRNLTWSELNAVGIVAAGGRVEAKKKEGEPQGQAAGGSGKDAPCSDAQRNMIFAKLQNELGMSTVEEKRQFSIAVTGKATRKDWTKGDIDRMVMEIGKRLGEGEPPAGKGGAA